MLPTLSFAQTTGSTIYDDFNQNAVELSKWKVDANPNIGSIKNVNDQLEMNLNSTAKGSVIIIKIITG